MRPEEEKKDDRICVAAPRSIVAWVRDRARVIGKSSSELCFDWIIKELYQEEGLRKCSDGKPEIVENLKAAQTALEAAFRQMGMVKATGREQRRRQTA